MDEFKALTELAGARVAADPPPAHHGSSMPLLRTTAVADQYRANWRVAQLAWLQYVHENKAEFLIRVADSLDDVFHSLGVARLATASAFVTYSVYDITWHWSAIVDGSRTTEFVLGVVVALAATVLTWQIASYNRWATLQQLLALEHDLITDWLNRSKRARAQQGKRDFSLAGMVAGTLEKGRNKITKR